MKGLCRQKDIDKIRKLKAEALETEEKIYLALLDDGFEEDDIIDFIDSI